MVRDPSSLPARSARIRAGAWLAALALSVAAPARAQVPGEEIARRSFEEGVALEKKGDYGAALAKFRESAQIKGTLGNRFHTAFCLEMTGKLVAALIEYEGVDRVAREQGKADVLEATRLRLEPLAARVPQLSLHFGAGQPKEGAVLLDDSAIAAALLEGKPFRIDAGEHVLTAHATGRTDFTKRFLAAEGTTTTIEVTFGPGRGIERGPRTAPDSEPRASDPRPEEPGGRSRPAAIAVTAGAVAFAAAGVVFFVVASGAQSDAEAECRTRLRCDDERRKVRTFDLLSVGSFVGAAGLAAVSIVLWTMKTSRRSATLRGGPSFVGLEGRF